MQVARIFVDECVMTAPAEAQIAATVFEFGPDRQWVTADPAVQGERLGPLTLPSDARKIDTPTVGMTSLGSRPMRVNAHDGALEVSYETVWTVDPSTVYALVLPAGFVPVTFSLEDELKNAIKSWQGVTADDRLFAYSLFFEHGAIDVSVVSRQEPEKARVIAQDVNVSQSTRRFEDLGERLVGETVRPDFILRLLEFGSRLAGLG
jgi:hypothetical protein